MEKLKTMWNSLNKKSQIITITIAVIVVGFLLTSL